MTLLIVLFAALQATLVNGVRNGITVPPYNVVNVETFALDILSPVELVSTIPFFPSIFTGAPLPLSTRQDYTIDVQIMLPNQNDDISACNGNWQTQNEFGQIYTDKFVLLLKSTCSGAQYAYAAASGARGVVVMGCSPLPPFNCPVEIVQDFSYVGVPTATVLFISNADGVRIQNYLLAQRAAGISSGVTPTTNSVTIRIKSTGNIVPEERAALISIMSQTSMGMFGQTNLPQPLPWWTLERFQDMSLDPCRNRTKGIWCEGGRIVHLNLMYHGWNTPTGIPTEFGAFTALRGMTVRTNNWVGALPDSFCNLVDLRWLWLNDQRLSGGITSIPNCDWPKMGDLQFWSNSITSLPPKLSTWKELRFLYGTNNKLTGSLPSFASLDKLTIVDLSSNLIQGALPTFHSQAPLAVVSLGNNQFSGLLPSQAFDGFSSLTVLDLNTNRLTGTLPNLIGCVNLKYIDLSSQRSLTTTSTDGFTGSMPPTWGLLVKVKTLYLQENSLISPFYTFKMLALEYLDASHNALTYATPDLPNNQEMSTWVNSILTPSIVTVKLSYNQLGPSGTGSFIVRFLTLKTLYLDHNHITSVLPELFQTGLSTFDISYNNVTGAFPNVNPSPSWISLNFKGNPFFSFESLPTWMQVSSNRLQESGAKFACSPLMAIGSDSMNVLVDPTFYKYKYCDCLPGNFGRPPLCSPVPTSAELTPYSIISSTEVGETFPTLIQQTAGVGSTLFQGLMPSNSFSDSMYGENRLTLGLSTSWVINLKGLYADDLEQYEAQGLTPPTEVHTYHLGDDDSSPPELTTPVRQITVRLHLSAAIMTSFDDVISVYEGGEDLKGTRVFTIRGTDTKPEMKASEFTSTEDYIRVHNASIAQVPDARLVEIQVFTSSAAVQFTSRMTGGLHFYATYSYDYTCPLDYFYDTLTTPSHPTCRPNYELYSPSSGIRSAVFAVGSVACLVVICNLVALSIFWNSAVYKAASRSFLLLILCLLLAMSLGSFLYAAVPVVGRSASNAICFGRVWLTCLPLAGILAVLLAKTARLNSIFNAKTLSVKTQTDLDILLSVGVICILQILMLSILTGLPLTRPDLSLGRDGLRDRLVTSCSQEPGFMSWFGAEVAFISAIILPAAYMGFKTRDLPSQYNESTHIQNAVVLLAFFGVIIIPLDIFIQDDPGAAILIQGLGQAFLCICLTAIIFGPKVYHVTQHGTRSASNRTQVGLPESDPKHKSYPGSIKSDLPNETTLERPTTHRYPFTNRPSTRSHHPQSLTRGTAIETSGVAIHLTPNQSPKTKAETLSSTHTPRSSFSQLPVPVLPLTPIQLPAPRLSSALTSPSGTGTSTGVSAPSTRTPVTPNTQTTSPRRIMKIHTHTTSPEILQQLQNALGALTPKPPTDSPTTAEEPV